MIAKIISSLVICTVCLTANAQNVGIGTTTPANKLSVNGNADFTGKLGVGTVAPLANIDVVSQDTSNATGIIQLRAPNMLPNSITAFMQGKNNIVIGNQAEYRFDYKADGDPFNAHTFGFNSIQPFVAFTGNQRVGIGTLTPNAKLHVVGNVKIADGNEGVGKVLTSDANGLATWAIPANGGLGLGAAVGNTPYWNGNIWVTNSSNIFNNGDSVGIGTTSPTNKFSVVGNADFIGKVGIRTTLPQGELQIKSVVNPTAMIDQQQIAGGGFTSNNDNWQSFTAGTTGWLTQVDLSVGNPYPSASSAPGTVSIYSGEGTSGTVLSSMPVTFQNPKAFKSFVLPNKVDVVAGQKYTIAFSTPWPYTGTTYWADFNASNAYTAGISSSASPNFDFLFKTYVISIVEGLIVANGNVGMGTTNPVTKLDIAGKIKISDGTQGAGKVLTSDSNGVASWTPITVKANVSANGVSNKIPFWKDSTTLLNSNMYWDSTNSRLGIGVANPVNTLQVNSTITNGGVHITTTNSGTTNTDGLFVGLGNVGDAIINNKENKSLQLYTNNTERIRILATGEVGIGTATAQAKLDIAGNIKITDGTQGAGKILTSDSAGKASWATPILKAGASMGNTLYWDGTAWVDNSFAIYNDGSSIGMGTKTPNNKLSVVGNADISGNVGLGITNPIIRLDMDTNQIIGTSRTFVTQHDITNRGTKVSFGYSIPGNEFLGMKAIVKAGTNGCGNSGDIGLYTWECNTSASREVMRINGSGNVGIGTTAPSAKLSVNGSANNTTGSWGVFSDARIKTINSDFTDGLNVINKIHTVKFNYNANAPFKADGEQIGIVAQELEKIAPYMVTKKEYADIKDLREVNNQAYVFLLINAVKELNTQNEQLKAELELIKNKLGITTQTINH